MDFPKILKQCQYERHLTNEMFSKYLGKSRAWLQTVYTTNPNVRKYLLGERTMFELNEKLDIPMSVMEQYNIDMLKRYQEQLKSDEDGVE